jgi:2-C-methyl-D-erythritol 4-phosphate cytidylyltransferase
VSNFAVILPAAGKSSRFRDKHYKKPFVPLGGKPVWLYSVERFLARADVKQVILVISPDDRELFQQKFAANVMFLGIDIVDGGAERADSIQNAMAKLKPEIDFVAVHDAARPCIADEWIARVFAAAEKSDAAILGVPVASTLKRVAASGEIEETVSRANLWEAQTPQVFRKSLLEEAYAKRAGFQATDDAQLVERLGRKVTVVAGSPINMKITTQDDLRFAEQAIKALPKPKNDFSNPFGGDDLFR